MNYLQELICQRLLALSTKLNAPTEISQWAALGALAMGQKKMGKDLTLASTQLKLLKDTIDWCLLTLMSIEPLLNGTGRISSTTIAPRAVRTIAKLSAHEHQLITAPLNACGISKAVIPVLFNPISTIEEFMHTVDASLAAIEALIAGRSPREFAAASLFTHSVAQIDRLQTMLDLAAPELKSPIMSTEARAFLTSNQKQIKALITLTGAISAIGAHALRIKQRQTLGQRFKLNTASLFLADKLVLRHLPYIHHLSSGLMTVHNMTTPWVSLLTYAHIASDTMQAIGSLRQALSLFNQPLQYAHGFFKGYLAESTPWERSSYEDRLALHTYIRTQLLGQGTTPSAFELMALNWLHNVMMVSADKVGYASGELAVRGMYGLFALTKQRHYFEYYNDLMYLGQKKPEMSLLDDKTTLRDTTQQMFVYFAGTALFNYLLEPLGGYIGSGVSTVLTRQQANKVLSSPAFLKKMRASLLEMAEHNLFNPDEYLQFLGHSPAGKPLIIPARELTPRLRVTINAGHELLKTSITALDTLLQLTREQSKATTSKEIFAEFIEKAHKANNPSLREYKLLTDERRVTLGNSKSQSAMSMVDELGRKFQSPLIPSYSRISHSRLEIWASLPITLSLLLLNSAYELIYPKGQRLKNQILNANGLDDLPLEDDLTDYAEDAEAACCRPRQIAAELRELRELLGIKTRELEQKRSAALMEIQAMHRDHEYYLTQIQDANTELELPSDAEINTLLEGFRGRLMASSTNSLPFPTTKEAAALKSKFIAMLQQHNLKKIKSAQLIAMRTIIMSHLWLHDLDEQRKRGEALIHEATQEENLAQMQSSLARIITTDEFPTLYPKLMLEIVQLREQSATECVDSLTRLIDARKLLDTCPSVLAQLREEDDYDGHDRLVNHLNEQSNALRQYSTTAIPPLLSTIAQRLSIEFKHHADEAQQWHEARKKAIIARDKIVERIRDNLINDYDFYSQTRELLKLVLDDPTTDINFLKQLKTLLFPSTGTSKELSLAVMKDNLICHFERRIALPIIAKELDQCHAQISAQSSSIDYSSATKYFKTVNSMHQAITSGLRLIETMVRPLTTSEEAVAANSYLRRHLGLRESPDTSRLITELRNDLVSRYNERQHRQTIERISALCNEEISHLSREERKFYLLGSTLITLRNQVRSLINFTPTTPFYGSIETVEPIHEALTIYAETEYNNRFRLMFQNLVTGEIDKTKTRRTTLFNPPSLEEVRTDLLSRLITPGKLPFFAANEARDNLLREEFRTYIGEQFSATAVPSAARPLS